MQLRPGLHLYSVANRVAKLRWNDLRALIQNDATEIDLHSGDYTLWKALDCIFNRQS